ncbi:MAG: hypothetical protein WBL84_24935, partial [Xanthobacteraceae bacterium]
MASEGKTPRRGREPRAIDASATDVAPGRPQEGADQPPSDAPAVSESASEAAAAPVSTPDAPAAPEASLPEIHAAEAAAPAETASEPSASEATEPVRPTEVEVPLPPPPRALRRRSLFWPMLASAIFGAVLGLAALAVIWRYSVLEPYNIDVGGKLASARLAALEARVRAIQPASAPAPGPAAVAAPVVSAPPPAVTKALDELTARVAKLEAAVQNPKPVPPDLALASRFAALENALKPLGDAVNAANKRIDDLTASLRDTRTRLDTSAKALDDLIAAQRQHPAAEKADLDKLDARLVTLEAATKSLATTAAAAGAADKSADRNLRTAVLANALRSAVMRGVPYAAELAGLKAQVADPQALAPLDAFAATGAPSQAALAQELAGLMPAITRAAEPGGSAAEGNFMQRLRARASEFVQIRPVGDAAGDDPAAIVARLNNEVARQDIAGAVAD